MCRHPSALGFAGGVVGNKGDPNVLHSCGCMGVHITQWALWGPEMRLTCNRCTIGGSLHIQTVVAWAPIASCTQNASNAWGGGPNSVPYVRAHQVPTTMAHSFFSPRTFERCCCHHTGPRHPQQGAPRAATIRNYDVAAGGCRVGAFSMLFGFSTDVDV